MLRFVAHRLQLLRLGFRGAIQTGDGTHEIFDETTGNCFVVRFRFIAKAFRGEKVGRKRNKFFHGGTLLSTQFRERWVSRGRGDGFKKLVSETV